MTKDAETLATGICREFEKLDDVRAVALGGSAADAHSDGASDIDLYVYATEEIPVPARNAIAAKFAAHIETGNTFFEPGDEWQDRATGIYADIMYRRPQWIEDRLDSVLVRHEACTGYTTCFWHNVRMSRILFDRDGWLAGLKERADRPYPPDLRRAIIAKNYPLLKDTISSYFRQTEKALRRRDSVSVNHRVAAFLASYFDVLFAVNGLTHPGEKKLRDYAARNCPLLPKDFDADFQALFAPGDTGGANLLAALSRLAENLRPLLEYTAPCSGE